MTKIYIIRHAEAEGNLYRIVQGQADSYVTSKGHLQIAALAERFRDIHLDALYTSDLRRTVATAEAITKYHDLEMRKTPRLREICMGVCEGMSFGDMRRYDPVQMDYFNNDPLRWSAEGAETVSQCTDRIHSAISDIAEAHDGETVAVVSHGVAIRSLLAKLLGIASRDMRTKLSHGDNTSVALLYYENGVFSVEYYNDNSHLPQELSTFARQTWWRSDAGGRDAANLRYESLDPAANSELYLECYADAWLTAHGDMKFFVPDLYLASAKSHFKDDPNSLLAVYAEDELAGMLELNPSKGAHAGYGWISLIYLKEDFRGRGLGVQPLGKAIIYYQGLGRKSVRLHVSSLNRGAVGFYEHMGFEILSTEAGAGAPLYLMEKKFN